MNEATPKNGPSPSAIWALVAAETISFLGSEISRFGVSVYIYETTRSVDAFATLLLANTVPGLLAGPIAGSIVDRYPRKRVMIGASVIALCGTLILLAGASLSHLSMTMIAAGAMLASVAEAFQWPALYATVPLMAGEDDLPRFNGFLESGRAASMLAGPIIGGGLFAFLHLRGLLLVEVVTFLVATTVVALVHIPLPGEGDASTAHEEGSESGENVSLWADSLFGLRFIYERRSLLLFLGVAVFANFFLSIVMVIMPPYDLGLLDEKSYGVASGLFGGGMIVGGLLYGILEKHFKNIQLFLGTAVLMGLLMAGYGFARGLVALGAINFMLAVLMTVGNAGILTIWQLKIPEEYAGRVLSAVRMVAYGTGPIAYLLAGPLADRVVPYLFTTSSYAATLTRIFGDSKSAQLGFLFSLMGVLLLTGFVLSALIRDVREVEEIAV